MSKTEFLQLTDLRTGELVYIDVSQIKFIQQLVAQDDIPRRTRIELIQSPQQFVVSEEAIQIALASGRGFYGPSDFKEGPRIKD